jgi:hypothetical protein
MNNKILTIAALAAVLVAGIFATTPMAAYAGGDYGDSSETKTKQEIKQKNSGSDASTNVNCADNDIGGAIEDGLLPFPPIDAQICGTAAIDLGDLVG